MDSRGNPKTLGQSLDSGGAEGGPFFPNSALTHHHTGKQELSPP